MQTFEQFLAEKHMEDYHGTDDDSPDAYEDWVTNLQVDDMITYAEEYNKSQTIPFLKKQQEEFLKKGFIPTIELLIEKLEEQK